jgi:hypothetical protein
MLAVAAVLVVWNMAAAYVATAPVAVVVDGILQCTIEPDHACRVTGIPAGTHLISTGAVKNTYDYGGVGRNGNSGNRITFQSYTTLKICRAFGLIPDTCDRWLHDTAAETPPGSSTQTVPYKAH